MSKPSIRIHQAKGDIVLTAVHIGRDESGLEAITAMKWRDSEGSEGRDSHVRLALHVERGGSLYVETDDGPREVVISPDLRLLRTAGDHSDDDDPILQLARY